MTPKQILDLSKANIGGGIDNSGINILTNDPTILLFMLRSINQVGRYFPTTWEVTVPIAQRYFDIDQSLNVWTVIEVTPLRDAAEGLTYNLFDIHPAIFGVGSSATESYTRVLEYIRARQNVRAMQVLSGREFDWEQSSQDPRRVYLDDVPAACNSLYVKFTTFLENPPTDTNDPRMESINYPNLQSELIIRHVTAQLKISEGRMLRKLRGGQQAAENDGGELVTEGTQELNDLETFFMEKAYILQSL
jgi:hypothetical protein